MTDLKLKNYMTALHNELINDLTPETAKKTIAKAVTLGMTYQKAELKTKILSMFEDEHIRRHE